MKQRQDERQDYETPGALFHALQAEFGPFDVDVAADRQNHKLPVWYGPGGADPDALSTAWVGRRFWMNPPYGRGIRFFVAKAVIESERGKLVCCLLPARTDTRWWHDYVIRYAKVIRFLRGRPKFLLDGKPKLSLDKKTGKWRESGGKFPSAVVVFGT